MFYDPSLFIALRDLIMTAYLIPRKWGFGFGAV
jgi:hypothetical protein